jgi:dolichyl-phosphate beta-glucosyltransferase
LAAPFLSIVIPAHNEEHRLPITLDKLFVFLRAQAYIAEVLVVENGSDDHTLQITQDFAKAYKRPGKKGYPEMRVLQETNPGKGRAVNRGMLAARGKYRFMCDADFSMPVPEINRFIPPQLNGADVVIASREAPGAVRHNEPIFRHLIGRAYNNLIRLIAVPGLHDTQCGFKCFRDSVAIDLFHQQTITGWSFDVEVLYIAQRRGYKIVELPIPWYFNPDSKVNVFKDSWRMALDLLTIRLNGLRGIYHGKV